ncbi:glycosyltransferase family 4 protein [Corynebacterium glutamicum]|uniref:glycosyltransferase family 4 protein n=1 Tax=Corynebacterium glutamicum TaxID=1718 RepID=UPI001B8BBBEC|nr:glycosyltransferase family 4 protein [Corynebacterium glutamicum]
MSSADLEAKIVIAYPYVPHYRYGIFKKLEDRISDITFISGRASKDGSIATIPEGTFKKEAQVENVWFGPFLWQKGLHRKLRDASPEAVVFMGDAAHLSTWVQAIIARIRRQKVYFWTIGWHRPDHGIRKIVRLLFYRIANDLLIYGNHGRKLGEIAGYPKDRMTVIYNSWDSLVSTQDFQLVPNGLPDGERPVIGAVIRLNPSKGLPDIVKSIAYLRDQYGVEADGLIIGEGPEREKLEALASELNVNLFLPGAVYNSEVLKMVYEKLTVTVVPKAAGLTVIQSLTEGVPVVTVADPNLQMPEFEAIEDGVTGSLVETTDASSIAGACAFWIERSRTASSEIREACQNMIQSYWSPQSQADRIISFLRDKKQI